LNPGAARRRNDRREPETMVGDQSPAHCGGSNDDQLCSAASEVQGGKIMEPRYRALRIIGTIYKVIGGLAGLVTILIVLSICATSVFGGAILGGMARDFGDGGGMGSFMGSTIGGLIGSLLVMLYGGTLSVTMFAFGEGVYLLLALEENTRRTAHFLAAGSPPAS
jgi:hypothetical protein